jgi:diaminopimelate epimerase
MSRPFIKMNGLGNDFVVVESGSSPFSPDVEEARAIASRAGGVGCDQLIALAPSRKADAFMRIWNADGGEVEACGNAARCIGWLLTEASGRDEALIETTAGIMGARRNEDKTITIDMGAPGLEWGDIPLAWQTDTREVKLTVAPGLGHPGCVSMGNPHAVFFVTDAKAAPVETVGPLVETHWLFPRRANVGFAQILAPDRIRLRVWERGVGVTKACGTGACAALVAAYRRGLSDRSATIVMDGGELAMEWRESDDHVLMTGPVAVEFTGRLPALEIA